MRPTVGEVSRLRTAIREYINLSLMCTVVKILLLLPLLLLLLLLLIIMYKIYLLQ